MPLAVTLALTVTTLVVLVLVFVLWRVFVFLRNTRNSLEEMAEGMETIARRAAPTGEAMASLDSMAERLEEFAAQTGISPAGESSNGDQAPASED